MEHILAKKWRALREGETDFEANCAQFVALLKQELDDVSWVGFYWNKADYLVVGAYQGPVACSRFPNYQGVCGSAYQKGTALIVPDVHNFPGHIACDPKARSEIVVPIKTPSEQMVGVLDLDSYSLARFTEEDKSLLETLVNDFSEHTSWPAWARS